MMTFRGEYGFLSNMYSVDFEWDRRVYHSSEAAFQSAKTLDPATRDEFSHLNGVAAKRKGRQVQLRWDWEKIKVDVMEEIIRAKFSQNPELAQKLIDTGDMELIEGNRWHDSFWGYDLIKKEGENQLGKILMKIRAELGGEAYHEKVELLRKEQAAAEEREKEERQKEIERIQAELNALPKYDFTGQTMKTRAFGQVVILRHEGSYLYFEANGMEKKFAFPSCVIQGFLIPEEDSVTENCKKRSELENQLKKLM